MPLTALSMTDSMKADAGDFDAWLQDIRISFRRGAGVDVPCGECRGCCSAGRFVHLVPSDRLAHSTIPKQFLHHAPGMPEGHVVMGYLDGGTCPMLKAGDCSIYLSRPSTCRTFDCRVLAATGLFMDGKWNERINERVQAWQFTFSSADGQRRLKAMKDTAAFIQHQAAAFPGGRAPSEPTTVAVLAIKVHTVFLSPSGYSNPLEVANAIVTESRRFESSPI
jgi:Fe-S-cluster containining protein